MRETVTHVVHTRVKQVVTDLGECIFSDPASFRALRQGVEASCKHGPGAKVAKPHDDPCDELAYSCGINLGEVVYISGVLEKITAPETVHDREFRFFQKKEFTNETFESAGINLVLKDHVQNVADALFSEKGEYEKVLQAVFFKAVMDSVTDAIVDKDRKSEPFKTHLLNTARDIGLRVGLVLRVSCICNLQEAS